MNDANYRIIILGTPCSGKSILSEKLSKSLEIASYDLDELNRDSSNNFKEVQESVQSIVQSDTWIIDGNDRKLLELICTASTHIIWLDYSILYHFVEMLEKDIDPVPEK